MAIIFVVVSEEVDCSWFVSCNSLINHQCSSLAVFLLNAHHYLAYDSILTVMIF